MGRRRKGTHNRLKSQIIANILANNRMSRKQLAIKAEMNYAYLCKLLSDNPESIPSEEIIGRISGALAVEPWQIAEGLEPLENFNVKGPRGLDSVVSFPAASEKDSRIAELINYLNDHPYRIEAFYTLYEICILLNDKGFNGRGFMEVIEGYKDRLKNLG